MFKDSKIDSYAGLTVGYNIVSAREIGTVQAGFSSSGSYFLYGGHLGLRYYSSQQLGAQVEVGYGLGVINVGISYKM